MKFLTLLSHTRVVMMKISKKIRGLFFRLLKKKPLRIAIVGGSNSFMRTGYTHYLNYYLSQQISCPTELNYYSLGGIHSIYGLIQEDRHNIASNNDIIFFESFMNDQYAIDQGHYTLDLAGQCIESFVRRAKKSNPECLIVIVMLKNLGQLLSSDDSLLNSYKSIAYNYELPFIDITKLLCQTKDLSYVRSLYAENDDAHFSKPYGVKVVAQKIIEELIRIGVIQNSKLIRKINSLDRPSIYGDSLNDLKFINNFEEGNFFIKKPQSLVYQNSVFREKYYPVSQGDPLRFMLKGRLVAIFVKADLDHGFMSIEFNNQYLCVSNYVTWMNNIKPRNAIILEAQPIVRFHESLDFSEVLISNCAEYPYYPEVGYHRILPVQNNVKKWKLNVIGIAYVGEIKSYKPRIMTGESSPYLQIEQ
jgi:hypothetical protein